MEDDSHSVISAKYFRNPDKGRIMSKIRVPKTSNINTDSKIQQDNYLRNNILNSFETNRTDNFLNKINNSYEQPKFAKNKIQLKSLDKINQVKPLSRPAVFERLTSEGPKNPRRRVRPDTNHKEQEEIKQFHRSKKAQIFHNIGDTGSSFDAVAESSNFESNPYDADYSNSLVKPIKTNSKFTFNNRSYIFTGAKNELDLLPVKKIVEHRELVYRHYVKSQVGKSQAGEKKVNQDSYISQKYLNNWVFGVLDGHGLYGHHASSFVKRLLLKSIFRKTKSKMYASESSSSKKGSESSFVQHKDIVSGFKYVHKYFEDAK